MAGSAAALNATSNASSLTDEAAVQQSWLVRFSSSGVGEASRLILIAALQPAEVSLPWPVILFLALFSADRQFAWSFLAVVTAHPASSTARSTTCSGRALCIFVASLCLHSACYCLAVLSPGCHRHQPIHPHLHQAAPLPLSLHSPARSTLATCAALWIVSFAAGDAQLPGLGRPRLRLEEHQPACGTAWPPGPTPSSSASLPLASPFCVIVIVLHPDASCAHPQRLPRIVQKLAAGSSSSRASAPFRLAKTLFLVFAVLVICWTPFTRAGCLRPQTTTLPIHLARVQHLLGALQLLRQLPGVRPDQTGKFLRGYQEGSLRRLAAACRSWRPQAAGLPYEPRTATLSPCGKKIEPHSRRVLLCSTCSFGFLAVAGRSGQNVSLPLWIDSGRPDHCGNRSTGNSSAGGELSADAPPLLLEKKRSRCSTPAAWDRRSAASPQLARSSSSRFFDALNGRSGGLRLQRQADPAGPAADPQQLHDPPERHLPPGAAAQVAQRLEGSRPALGVFLALVVSSCCPPMVPSLGGGNRGRRLAGIGRVLWPVVFMLGFVPAAVMNVLQEKWAEAPAGGGRSAAAEPHLLPVQHQLLPAAHRARPVLEWTLCPATATPDSLWQLGDSWRFGGLLLLWRRRLPRRLRASGAAMFIGMYTVSYIGGAASCCATPRAPPCWPRGVRALVTRCGSCSGPFFQEDPFQFHIQTSYTTWFALASLSLMVPAILAYNWRSEAADEARRLLMRNYGRTHVQARRVAQYIRLQGEVWIAVHSVCTVRERGRRGEALEAVGRLIQPAGNESADGESDGNYYPSSAEAGITAAAPAPGPPRPPEEAAGKSPGPLRRSMRQAAVRAASASTSGPASASSIIFYQTESDRLQPDGATVGGAEGDEGLWTGAHEGGAAEGPCGPHPDLCTQQRRYPPWRRPRRHGRHEGARRVRGPRHFGPRAKVRRDRVRPTPKALASPHEGCRRFRAGPPADSFADGRTKVPQGPCGPTPTTCRPDPATKACEGSGRRHRRTLCGHARCRRSVRPTPTLCRARTKVPRRRVCRHQTRTKVARRVRAGPTRHFADARTKVPQGRGGRPPELASRVRRGEHTPTPARSVSAPTRDTFADAHEGSAGSRAAPPVDTLQTIRTKVPQGPCGPTPTLCTRSDRRARAAPHPHFANPHEVPQGPWRPHPDICRTRTKGPAGSACRPQTGCYRIEALGASGGFHQLPDRRPRARAVRRRSRCPHRRVLQLSAGTVLTVVVGQRGRAARMPARPALTTAYPAEAPSCTPSGAAPWLLVAEEAQRSSARGLGGGNRGDGWVGARQHRGFGGGGGGFQTTSSAGASGFDSARREAAAAPSAPALAGNATSGGNSAGR
uniref:G_PROTEIN_RECEP_F1_2 domain-containing protein n=1 Tax=Macrostomum lignano TaxID=282301 RepID=A0A1I8JRU0_9PLAT